LSKSYPDFDGANGVECKVRKVGGQARKQSKIREDVAPRNEKHCPRSLVASVPGYHDVE
jgi:hypothetical protein